MEIFDFFIYSTLYFQRNLFISTLFIYLFRRYRNRTIPAKYKTTVTSMSFEKSSDKLFKYSFFIQGLNTL
jgi:hypothetical protein